MPIVSPYLSIITFDVNALNSAIKRHTQAEWITEQDSTIFSQKICFMFKETYTLKVENQKKIPCK
jgi:hypothetical protein